MLIGALVSSTKNGSTSAQASSASISTQQASAVDTALEAAREKLKLNLLAWRKAIADKDGIHTVSIMSNAGIEAIKDNWCASAAFYEHMPPNNSNTSDFSPTTIEELRNVRGITDAQIFKYGAEIVALVLKIPELAKSKTVRFLLSH